jgi:hypothetical protein
MAKKEPLDETWEVWINTLLANPTGPPTVALTLTGGFLGIKLADWLKTFTLPALPDFPTTADVTSAVTATLDAAKIGVTPAEESAFVKDGAACIAQFPKYPPGDFILTPLGIADPLRETKIAACMIRKGWGGDVVLNWLREKVGV